MKLSVPSRLQTSLIDGLAALGVTDRIAKVYGSPPLTPIGHGRVSSLLSRYGEVGPDGLRRFADAAHARGIEVCYLANSLCLGELGYEADGAHRIAAHIAEVAEAGADMVTVGSPFVLRIIKRDFPKLKVAVSVYAEIDTVAKMQRWEDLGADLITLPARMNRDFGLLARMAKVARVDLELLVNESCLLNCPYALYHHTTTSHRSRDACDTPDYCMLECTKDRVRNLAELLRAPWIRPEDIGWYADRFGIKTFKIQGRQMPEQWVLNAVRSYLDGRFEGNLLDLISPTFPDWSSRYGKVNGIGEAAVERAHFARPSVAIDNQRLDDFVAGLKQRGGCSAARGCDTCHFCDDEAPGLIEVADPAQLAGYGAVTRRLLDGVLDTRPA